MLWNALIIVMKMDEELYTCMQAPVYFVKKYCFATAIFMGVNCFTNQPISRCVLKGASIFPYGFLNSNNVQINPD